MHVKDQRHSLITVVVELPMHAGCVWETPYMHLLQCSTAVLLWIMHAHALICNSCKTLIGVHEMYGRMHPN